MFRRVLSAALVAAGLAGLPVMATTLHEDFASLGPRETGVASLDTAIGTITGLAGTPTANVYLAPPGYSNFGIGTNPTTATILTANGDEHFDVALLFAARSVRLDAWLNDAGPATLAFYNGNTLLDTISFAADADNLQHIAYRHPSAPVTRFTFQSTLGRLVNTGIGNIRITSVPEPADWALLGIGFAVIGLLSRRRTLATVPA